MADSEQQSLIIRAGEYVLGTLDADECARFESELAANASARDELAYWEQRLGAIGLALAPVEPPAQLWAGIEKRTFATSSESTAGRAANDSGGRGWRGLAIAASAAALIMAVMLFTSSSPRFGAEDLAPAYASMVYDAPTGTSWLVSARHDSDAMSVTAMGNYDVPKGKVLRAWLVPAQGDPVPLGEWPHTRGRYEMRVSEAAARYISKRASLMVSMEDVASSNPNAPSGKLMWTSPIALRTG